jgi:hypothetical protein
MYVAGSWWHTVDRYACNSNGALLYGRDAMYVGGVEEAYGKCGYDLQTAWQRTFVLADSSISLQRTAPDVLVAAHGPKLACNTNCNV